MPAERSPLSLALRVAAFLAIVAAALLLLRIADTAPAGGVKLATAGVGLVGWAIGFATLVRPSKLAALVTVAWSAVSVLTGLWMLARGHESGGAVALLGVVAGLVATALQRRDAE